MVGDAHRGLKQASSPVFEEVDADSPFPGGFFARGISLKHFRHLLAIFSDSFHLCNAVQM